MILANASERRLALLLLALVVGLASYLLGSAAWGRLSSIREQRAALETEIALDRDFISKAGDWRARESWILENQPQAPEIPASDLLGLLEQAEKKAQVKFSKPLTPSNTFTHGQFSSTASVGFEIEGELEPIVTFLYHLQGPDAFRSIEDLKLRPVELGANRLACSARLVAQYRPPGQEKPAAP